MKVFMKAVRGRHLTAKEADDWFQRFKKAGSALSTTRMCLRLAMGIDNLGYFLKQLRQYRQSSKSFD